MWDRAVFAVRRFLLDLGGNLGSWRLSVVLLVWAALFQVLLAIWAARSPAHVVRSIASLLPFWLVYTLLLVNTAVCLWQRLGALRADIGRRPRLVERVPEWEAPAPATAPAARAAVRHAGFRLLVEAEGRLVGVKRRWAALGTYVFHGALFLVALGFLTSMATRQEAKVRVTVGEEFEGAPDQYVSRSAPTALAGGVPEPRFTVDRIDPQFWRDEMLFTQLEADLVFADGQRRLTRINRPLWLGAATFLRLSGFGYAPRYELLAANDLLLDTAIVKLDVFPPGLSDYFVPPRLPHRLYVRVLPDHAPGEGRPVTRTLNMANPAVVLEVFRGRLGLGGAVLPLGQGYTFEGLTLRFPEIRYWGEFDIVWDPGMPILFTGYGLGLAGLLVKLRGERAELEWVGGADGGPGRWRGWGAPLPGPLGEA